MPLLSLAAASDNLTQRKPNPYFLRASATSSQAMQPLGHYAATELKLKRVVTAADDLAFGYEEIGGFQAAFKKDGGCLVNKLWPPLVTPDYTPYVAQIADCDGVGQAVESVALHEGLWRRGAQISRGDRRDRRRQHLVQKLRR